MEHISISKHTFDTLVESLEDLRKVLNNVDYEKDSTDPKNIEHCAAYAVGYSKSSIDSILWDLNTITKESN